MTEDFLVPLISLLAERHGQRGIAAILNERELWRPADGGRWHEPAVSRFMNQHDITPHFTFKVYPEYEKTPNY